MKNYSTIRKESGVVLIMSLMVLAMVAVMALYAGTRATVEQKVAANSIGSMAVFYQAEAGLAHGKALLEGLFADNNSTASTNDPPDWTFLLNGSMDNYSAAAMYWCQTASNSVPCEKITGDWIDNGVQVVTETSTIGNVTYTYTVTAYDNNETGATSPSGTSTPACLTNSNNANDDCDGVIIVRSVAVARVGLAVVGESIQEQSYSGTVTPTLPEEDEKYHRKGSNSDKNAVDTSGSARDI